ncbi:MAG: zinc-ribbon domain-containing protein [Myxococcota bacterium]|nr:zinc-ribbon domain-containing protein [Myxococcota bacterium]
MVVECRKCGTRFQLDAARIPDSGIRVRCSRCKHAFFLQHPDHSDADGVTAAVEQAVRGEAPPPPDATQDLLVADPGVSADAQTVAATPDDDFIDDEEDDWEFNEDLPSYDDDDDDDDDASGLEAEVDPVVEAEQADPEEMSANDLMSSSIALEPESPFDAVGREDDEASLPLADDDEPMPESVEGVREAAFGSVDDFSSLAEAEEVTAAPEAVPPVHDDGSIEDPESWDFFGDAAKPTDASCTPEDPFGAAFASGSANASRFEGVGETLDDAVSSQDWPKLEENAAIGAAGRIVSALGWTLVSALIVLGAALGLRDTFDPGVRAPAYVAIGEMRAANVKGQWVESSAMGRLYVVSGDLLNPGTQPAIPDLTIEVRLLDGHAELSGGPTTIAGSGIDFDRLRTLASVELPALREQATQALAFSEIAGGESVRFAAIFEALPDEATHFQLEARGVEGLAPPTPVLEGDDTPVARETVLQDDSAAQAADVAQAGATSASGG